MTFAEYQVRAEKLAFYAHDMKVLYPTLGLCGEAGEVADKVKKVYRDNHGVFNADIRKDILKELGDVLWYVTLTGSDLGFSLEEIAIGNITKLEGRHERNTLTGSGDNR